MAHDTSLDCAAWLHSYQDFHRADRHSRHANYIVYTCRENMPGTHNHCLGLGDRFRHIAFMLRLAAATQRILLIDWASPLPLERYFSPASIDWRLTTQEFVKTRAEPVLRWGITKKPLPSTRYVRIVGNMQWSSMLASYEPSNSTMNSNFLAPSFSCLWRFMFTPSAFLEAQIREQRRLIFGVEHAPYNAIHLRMGDGAPGSAFDLRTVPKSDVRLDRREAEKVLGCVANYSSLPVFLATDNAHLKTTVMGGMLPFQRRGEQQTHRPVLVHNFTGMVNPVFKHNFSTAAVDSSFIDLGLIVQATCLFVHTIAPGGGWSIRLSSFTTTAIAWAGEQKCLKKVCWRGHRPIMPDKL
uniref:O-fucosyltransferase family protein n=1 Tax=Coccolithus braarudii TaxID=221442 RepID=A0A7S0Q474_9EUKA|mmetsp:Transcript_4609/g.10000  ORF Transcript_4609/g.10000 Transcript_4609/m.10000 type:complete len:354 (+) Transcript_4609:15-1076(+)